MFKNYLKIAFRNIKRRKISTAITATGLVLGISAFIFILQYVAFEFSVNKYHENSEDIYRVLVENQRGNISESLPPALAPAVKENVPGVKHGTRFADGICSGIVEAVNPALNEPTPFRENDCMYTDQEFFEVFSTELIDGERDLSAPRTAVITKSLAIKLFGQEYVAGEVFIVYNQFGDKEFTISGVVEDVPAASSINSNMMLSFSTLNENQGSWADPNGWSNGFAHHFLILEDAVNPIDIGATITDLSKTVNPNDEITFSLQPFSEVHLGGSVSDPNPTTGSMGQVLLILCVGIMIMVIGWANYINLSTAQGLERAKQVGIQQTSGASKLQLMGQFLTETFLFSLLGLAMSIAVVELLQPFFNQLINRELSIELLNRQNVWLFGTLYFLAGTLAAGGYVAFVITSLSPSEVLKGSSKNSAKGLRLRRVLVVFQFSISIILIVATFVFTDQLSFMQTRDLGMSLDNRIVVRGASINKEGQNQSGEAFKDQLSNFSFIDLYSGSNNVPGNGYNFSAAGIYGQNSDEESKKKSYAILFIDQYYIEAYELTLAAGRNYDENAINASWDSNELIVNEKSVIQLGYSSAEDAIGNSLFWGENEYRIIGVVEDYHHASLQQAIEPMVFIPQNSSGYYTMQFNNSNFEQNIAEVRQAYEAFFPGNPFEYFFVENNYDQQYVQEARFSNFFQVSALLAIFIACLGLFGLAAYTASARTKEIGVRKVLGATVLDITMLLSSDFLKLVIIAFVISSPIAWYIMNEWLANFAYATSLNVWIFLLAGGLALLIALGTVSGKAIQAALANPVDSLKNE